MAPTSKGHFNFTSHEMAEMCDVIFLGDDEVIEEGSYDPRLNRRGFVHYAAKKTGQRAIQELFPGVAIRWFPLSSMVGWSGGGIHVPAAVDQLPDHRIPRDLIDGIDLDKASSDELALILVKAVARRGLTIVWRGQQGMVQVWTPPRPIDLEQLRQAAETLPDVAAASRDLPSSA
jgi:hypothetical protein